MDEVVEALEKYQGLVPLVYDIEAMDLDEARPQDMPYAVYLKREADKVIAHQKYKRCLAMAKLCRLEWAAAIFIPEKGGTDKQAALYMKWEKRWLALADKFKEA